MVTDKDLLAFQTKKAGRFLAIKNKKKDMKMYNRRDKRPRAKDFIDKRAVST